MLSLEDIPVLHLWCEWRARQGAIGSAKKRYKDKHLSNIAARGSELIVFSLYRKVHEILLQDTRYKHCMASLFTSYRKVNDVQYT